jgi:hypothetical protein
LRAIDQNFSNCLQNFLAGFLTTETTENTEGKVVFKFQVSRSKFRVATFEFSQAAGLGFAET